MQVYLNASLAYVVMLNVGVPYSVAAPGALIGASNFFELAVATAIVLFGAESSAALATVVGVLVEAPVMLSICGFCNRTRHWFAREVQAGHSACCSCAPETRLAVRWPRRYSARLPEITSKLTVQARIRPG
ncbi:hypothetical protein NSPZN2_100080 [Nitrospira defluvii]|uniref:Uncharacterized protein n=1 Tax=Nitrospira defluvii TaxID=330214 RepID=A0ABM8QZU0_9BACT|nr:hypothetical protein NSPZN2_100080 [Nitrospira defluvii]